MTQLALYGRREKAWVTETDAKVETLCSGVGEKLLTLKVVVVFFFKEKLYNTVTHIELRGWLTISINLQHSYNGFTGNIQFDEHGKRINFNLHYSKLDDDKFVHVGLWDSKTNTLNSNDKYVSARASNLQVNTVIKVSHLWKFRSILLHYKCEDYILMFVIQSRKTAWRFWKKKFE